MNIKSIHRDSEYYISAVQLIQRFHFVSEYNGKNEEIIACDRQHVAQRVAVCPALHHEQTG